MPARLTTHAVEKSTYVVTAAFTDEAGAAVIPSAITWTLTDVAGTVINGRSSVSVAVPSDSVDMVLSDLDLALQTGEQTRANRILTVEATYSSSLGDNLPLKDQVIFRIDDLKVVT